MYTEYSDYDPDWHEEERFCPRCGQKYEGYRCEQCSSEMYDEDGNEMSDIQVFEVTGVVVELGEAILFVSISEALEFIQSQLEWMMEVFPDRTITASIEVLVMEKTEFDALLEADFS